MPSPLIAAVMIHTPEPGEALAWYERAFPKSQRRNVGEPAFALLDIGEVQLEFVLSDEKVSAGPAGTVVYWWTESFESELQRLRDIGAKLYRGPMRIEDDVIMCQVRDPWGNCLGMRGRTAK